MQQAKQVWTAQTASAEGNERDAARGIMTALLLGLGAWAMIGAGALRLF